MADDVIKNQYPELNTTVTLTTPFVGACPHSGEPGPGSGISVTYSPVDWLIELHAVEKYLKGLTEGSEALDLETVVQRLAMLCQGWAGVSVEVKAVYKLLSGIEVVCECRI